MVEACRDHDFDQLDQSNLEGQSRGGVGKVSSATKKLLRFASVELDDFR